jgi:NTE family protein
MDIEHLIMSGGGSNGFMYLGILHKLIESSIINNKTIKTIHATSIGTIVATIFLLDKNIYDTKQYFLKRPWNKLMSINIYTLFNSIYNGGIFDKNILEKILDPILKSNDIELDINLEEFKKITEVEIYFIAVRYDTFSPETISSKTHPKWKLIDAIYSSCCLPLLFKPFDNDSTHYLDGGIISNYPVDIAKETNGSLEKTLGICSSLTDPPKMCYNPMSKLKLLDYIFNLIWKLWAKNTNTEEFRDQLPYEIIVGTESYDGIYKTVEIEEERTKLYDKGYSIAENFIKQNISIMV